MAAAFFAIARRRRSALILAAALICVFLFAEDSFRLHETIGGNFLAGIVPGDSYLESRRIGQFWYGLALGITAIAILGVLYRFADRKSKQIASVFVLFLILLGIFGVLVDAIPDSAAPSPAYLLALKSFEEFGELLVMSGACWWAVSCWWAGRTPAPVAE